MQSQITQVQKTARPPVLVCSIYLRAILGTCLSLILCFICLGCARFRVQELEALPRFSLDIVPAHAKNPDMKLQVLEKEGLTYNFPLRPAIAGSKMYFSDVNRKIVRVFSDNQEEPLLILSASRPPSLPANSSIPYRQLDLGIPAWIAVDEDTEELYIQSYSPIAPSETRVLPPEKRLPGRHSRILQSPSLILNLNKKGELIGKIGKEGYNTPPFNLILQIYPDAEERLNVLHKSKETKDLELLVFEKGRLLRRFSRPELDIDLKAKQKLLILEHIQAVAGRDFVIGSLAVRKKSNYDLLERIIYQQSTPGAKARVLLRNDTLIDFLVWADRDGSFYMLQTEESGSDLLFKIFSSKGEYLGNRSIELPGLRSSWRDMFFSLKGRVFNSRVSKNKFLLYEWK